MHGSQNTRTRFKFVADDGQEFTTEYLTGIKAQIAIQGSQQQAKEDVSQNSSFGDVTMEEIEMITRLRKMGWYGGLYKKTSQLTTVKFDMPELDRQG